MLTGNTVHAGVRSDAGFRHRLRSRPHLSRAAWIDILIGLVAILPLLLTAHLPLTDLPNHLARQYIIRDWASSPSLQSFYYIHWALVPNLGLELFVLVARQVISIDMAVRAFCIITVVLLFCGTRLLNRELIAGQARLYRAAPLLCYGGPFQYGFLSYCLGIGIALNLFAIYLRIRTGRPLPLIAFLLASSFILLLCHLAALGLFAVAIGACELTFGFTAAGGHIKRLPVELIRSQIVPMCGLVPMFLVFVWLSPTAGVVKDNALIFSTFHERLRSFISITYFTSLGPEVGLLVLALTGLAAGLLVGIIRFSRIGLVTVVAMSVAWLLLPNIAMGAAFIDYRVPWAWAFFLLAALVPGPRYQRLIIPFGLYYAALVVARIGIIAVLWQRWEPTLTAIDQSLSRLPIGTSMMVIEGRLPNDVYFRQPDLANVASFVVARRQAFEPNMFASLPGQILYFQPRYFTLWDQGGFARRIPSTLDDLAPEYDYVLVLLPALAHISPRLPLACLDTGPNFEILRVVRDGSSPSNADRPAGCVSIHM